MSCSQPALWVPLAGRERGIGEVHWAQICQCHKVSDELWASQRAQGQPWSVTAVCTPWVNFCVLYMAQSLLLPAGSSKWTLRGAFLLHPRAIFTSFQVAFEMKTEKGRSQVVAVVTLMMLIAAAEEFFSKGEKQDEAKAGIYLQHHTAHAPS